MPVFFCSSSCRDTELSRDMSLHIYDRQLLTAHCVVLVALEVTYLGITVHIAKTRAERRGVPPRGDDSSKGTDENA